MAYDYVKRTYGVNPVVGARVRHPEMKGPRSFGTIARENPSQGHHVMVRFDGQNFASPSHPTALDYAPVEAEGQS
jgi:hypothetical protein